MNRHLPKSPRRRTASTFAGRILRTEGSTVRVGLLARCAPLLGLAALASGCALQVRDGADRAVEVARYATSWDHVVDPRANLLDRALADCSEKTVKAETACVRQGIDAAHPPVAALIALVPGCRAGQVCHYDHTTHDRLGFVRASATDYVKHWRIDLDLTHPAADATSVPVTVVDREDFDAAPPPGKPPAKPR